MQATKEKKQRKKLSMPSSFTVLFIIIAIMAILTWFIPAGRYGVNDNGDIVPGTYEQVEATPQGVWDVLMAPINGMLGTEGTPGAIQVALFILVVGGFLKVVNATGALDAGIASIVAKNKGKEKALIPILMILFALGGSMYGMAEETIPFYVLLIPVMMAVGFDTITAVAIVLVGSQVGCLASIVNPFATGVASDMAGISIADGMGLRIIMFVILVATSIVFVYRYATKIERNPEKSVVYAQRKEDEEYFDIYALQKVEPITRKQKTVNTLFFVTFGIMIIAVIPWPDLNEHFTLFDKINSWLVDLPVVGVFLGKDMLPWGDWYFSEITMLFMVMAAVIAAVFGISETKFVNEFIAGAAELVGVALIVAVARGIQVVMDSGQITDTILHWGEGGLSGLPSTIFILLMFLFFIPMSFLIPSTSGLAAATMGIMAPLGEFADVPSSLVVTAYQSASGLVNLVTPTSAIVMGALTIARTNLGVWLKFMLGLWITLLVEIMVILGIAALF